MKTDVLIIGGGLSGLALANGLGRAGIPFELVEARARFGGRIHHTIKNGAHFDLGPAWFWPGQPRMAQLLAEFDLPVFEQFATGAQLYEDETGQLHHGRGFASMAGSYRVDGGFSALIGRLQDHLPGSHLHLSQTVKSLTRRGQTITASFVSNLHVEAETVVLALPPRLAAGLTYAPDLPPQLTAYFDETPTWMAGHAKALALYDAPFWRDAGLSGDGMSRLGPLAELHDASPASNTMGAIFGFLGVPPEARHDTSALKAGIKDQIARFFGTHAPAPKDIILQDWVLDPFTAAPKDQEPLYAHPTYGASRAMEGLWDGRLHFAGSETDQEFGGYLEGALKAAETVLARLVG